jgi:hypothetical protein
MRRVAPFLVIIWAVQLISVAVSAVQSISAPDVPLDAWLFLLLHALIAAVGVVSGVALLRGLPAWVWLALASSLSLLAITDFAWYSFFSKAQTFGGVLKFVLAFPKLSFAVFVMPVFAVIVALIAISHLSTVWSRARPHA